MNKTSPLTNVLLALAGLALLAALHYLYEKTQAVDLRERNEVLDLLRTLEEIDNQWDVDILRERAELALEPQFTIDRAAIANKALQALAASLEKIPSAALQAGLADLSKAISEKAVLLKEFNSANATVRAALATLKNAAIPPPGREASPLAVSTALRELIAAATEYYWSAQEPHRIAMVAALARVSAADVASAERFAKINESAQAMFKLRPLEETLYRRLAFLTAGPRLNALTFAYTREVEALLADKERYRVYLIAYAGALLILLGYLGGKLKTANISLERRVQERTQELTQALQHLKESEAQLIQSEKMSSLGQMVAGVAHEINTPLAYVKNSLGTVVEKLPAISSAIAHCEKLLSLLQSGGQANKEDLNREFAATTNELARLKRERVLEDLARLTKDGVFGITQMAEIVGNLKDFSRLDRSRISRFNLNEGLDSTLLLAKHLLKPIKVEKHYAELPPVICSPSQINQVFLNLITNAAQAMENKPGMIVITTGTENDGVNVKIADTGPGISAEVLPKIFDPFFSTKEIGKGTGLGLSISYKIVQQHGGRITVESQIGKGTTFDVWLPLKPPLDLDLTT